MRTITGKLLISFVLTLGFCVLVSAQPPPMPPTNRLETGGNYDIAPPPTNMMFQVTDNPANAGDDNLIWSNSGRILAVDRSDPTVTNLHAGSKYVCLLDVRNLGNIQVLGARSSAAANPLFANITGWTWNDDRVLFGWQQQVPTVGKVRLMSCTSSGVTNVSPFLMADPQDNPTNHIYSPSVVYDPFVNKERLLCLVSSSTNNNESGPTDVASQPDARINLFTVPFDSDGVPSWNDRVQLTAFSTNLSIASAKWCPELGTNYQPIANRLVILFTGAPQGGPPVDPAPPAENNKIVVFNDVQGVIADPATAPTSLDDPRLVIIETNLTMSSQVSWTFDGQNVMFGRMPGDIYSIRADSSTNIAVKFEVPDYFASGQKQWLSISPDGMKAAFTVDHKAYIIPLQFDNVAVTGAVVTNVLTDASYTAVDVPGDAIDSNTVFSIVAPPSVDTNNFNGEFSGFAREISVSGVSSQFNLNTNAEMSLHFSQSDIPAGASVTNLAVYVYNSEGTGGQTGTWDKLESVINTNLQTITCTAQHFSIYSIGRASVEPEPDPESVVVATALTADFDGDQLADAALYNTNGNWSLKLSSGGYSSRLDLAGFLGGSGYTALAADFDGDMKADPAIYNAELELWAVKLSSLNYLAPTVLTSFGGSGWQALAGDFDGDRLADPALYNTNGTWKVKLSTAAYTTITSEGLLGFAGWTAIAADFDGDGKVDPAIYQASTGSWIVLLSRTNYAIALLDPNFLGSTGYIGMAADFDGDGYADPTVAKTSTGNWKVKLSSGNYGLVDLPGFLGE